MDMIFEGQTAIVNFEGEINFWNSNGIKERIKKVINDDVKRLVIDMEKVSFIDSSGAGLLVSLYKFMEKRRGVLSVCKLNKDVSFVIEISKLNNMFKTYESKEEALKAFI